MKTKINLILFLLSFSSLFSQSLDKIYLKNKEVVNCKVIRVTSSNVEIDPEGSIPFNIIERSDIRLIIYSDNTIVSFDDDAKSTNNHTSNEVSTPSENDLLPFNVRKDGIYVAKTPIIYNQYRTSLAGAFSGRTLHWPVFAYKSSDKRGIYYVKDLLYYGVIEMKKKDYDKMRINNLSSVTFESLRENILSDENLKHTLKSGLNGPKNESVVYVHSPPTYADWKDDENETLLRKPKPYIYSKYPGGTFIYGEIKAQNDYSIKTNFFGFDNRQKLTNLYQHIINDWNDYGTIMDRLFEDKYIGNADVFKRENIIFQFIPITMD